MTKETPITSIKKIVFDALGDSFTEEYKAKVFEQVDLTARFHIADMVTTHTQELTSQITLLREELRETQKDFRLANLDVSELKAQLAEKDKRVNEAIEAAREMAAAIDYDSEICLQWEEGKLTAEQAIRAINNDNVRERYKTRIQAMLPIVKAVKRYIDLYKDERDFTYLDAISGAWFEFMDTKQANELIGE